MRDMKSGMLLQVADMWSEVECRTELRRQIIAGNVDGDYLVQVSDKMCPADRAEPQTNNRR